MKYGRLIIARPRSTHVAHSSPQSERGEPAFMAEGTLLELLCGKSSAALKSKFLDSLSEKEGGGAEHPQCTAAQRESSGLEWRVERSLQQILKDKVS